VARGNLRGGPRRVDFYIKRSLGNWAEEIVNAFWSRVGPQFGVVAYRYGYSAGRIPKNLSEFKEILKERSQLEFGKRPNFLIFRRALSGDVFQLMRKPDSEIEETVRNAVLAVETEFSAWYAKRTRRRLSFTVKEEDVEPLMQWQKKFSIEIVVFQVFMDELHMALLSDILNFGKVEKNRRIHKNIYKYPVSSDTRLADITNVSLECKVEIDEGRIVPFIVPSGGEFANINPLALRRLEEILRKKG